MSLYLFLSLVALGVGVSPLFLSQNQEEECAVVIWSTYSWPGPGPRASRSRASGTAPGALSWASDESLLTRCVDVTLLLSSVLPLGPSSVEGASPDPGGWVPLTSGS